jgi:hypothetical protein
MTMATITITNTNPTLSNLREILSRIVDQYRLVWNVEKTAIVGNGMSASIDFEGEKPVSVTIKSTIYTPEILEEVAKKVRGNG